MTEIPTLERPGRGDYVFVAVLCVCGVSFLIPGAFAVVLLQRQLAPSDSFLFGPTPLGLSMLVAPTILLVVPVVALSKYVADRICHLLKMAPVDLLPASSWSWRLIRSTNWRLTGTISVAFLVAIGAKGFGSYFYVTERGLSVRPPLEFSVRHYRWEDVASVSIECRSARKGRGFRYVLGMSDGYDIDFSTVPTQRFDEAFERITSRLDSLSGVRYEFDISETALVALGSEHGAAGLENAIRSLVLRHGGVIQH